jgi:hypothetical protein
MNDDAADTVSENENKTAVSVAGTTKRRLFSKYATTP